jgi:hypothetical protein
VSNNSQENDLNFSNITITNNGFTDTLDETIKLTRAFNDTGTN